jgi:hypothetical protein
VATVRPGCNSRSRCTTVDARWIGLRERQPGRQRETQPQLEGGPSPYSAGPESNLTSGRAKAIC